MHHEEDENDHEYYEEEEIQEQPLTEDMINKLLEEAEQVDNRMTAESLKICLNNLEEKYQKNKDLRKKFKGNPTQYADSEADLHEEIKVLQRIAAYPDLIIPFLDLKGIEILINILQHENIDIVSDSLIVIDEITDSDFLQDIENPKEFLEYFITNNIFEILVNTLSRLNEKNKDDVQIVSDILSIFENFIEIYSFAGQVICEKTKLLNWLIKRIGQKDGINIRLFCSELINSLISSTVDHQMLFMKRDGLNKAMSVFLDSDIPKDEVEEEFIFNIVDIICCVLLNREAQEEFKNLHGINHMLNIMRENNIFRILAVKLLNFVTLNNETNCSELIELEGLKSIFSYFMGKGLKGKKNEDIIESIEEHILSLIASLFKFTKSVQYDRLIYKFKENNHEKCERIIEFYKKYDDLLKGEEDEERFENVLFTLQYAAIILGCLLTCSHEDIKIKCKNLFPMNNITVMGISKILEDMSQNLGEDFESDETFSNKRFVDNLIKGLNN
jgi:beta-catenin-like protein 1